MYAVPWSTHSNHRWIDCLCVCSLHVFLCEASKYMLVISLSQCQHVWVDGHCGKCRTSSNKTECYRRYPKFTVIDGGLKINAVKQKLHACMSLSLRLGNKVRWAKESIPNTTKEESKDLKPSWSLENAIHSIRFASLSSDIETYKLIRQLSSHQG